MNSHKSPSSVEEKLPFIIPGRKCHIKKSEYIIKQAMKMNLAPISRPTKLSLLSKLRMAIDANDNKKLQKLFHKFAIFVKDIENFEQVEQKEDTVKILRLFLDFKNLFRVVNENEEDIYDLIEIGLNCANYIKLDIKYIIADIMLSMSKDRSLKKKLIAARPLHILADALILEDNDELVRIVEKVLQNLLEVKNTTSFIPGEKLESERSRILIIQHGVIFVLAHVASSGKSKENCIMAEYILSQSVKLYELKWTLLMLIKHTLHKEPIFRTDIYINSFSIEDDLKDDRQYANLWTNKNLILSKYRSV
eukprot:TRINITY_DN510_c0_g1_i29.p1 TRINITY_DN510_c0_g1~~TRINITY_DN510_c0_g1_i29.p1  ORF type:complete len:307 (+),score=72.83 TRINITY_DN510_c0_g1_i29:176-1096(+)